MGQDNRVGKVLGTVVVLFVIGLLAHEKWVDRRERLDREDARQLARDAEARFDELIATPSPSIDIEAALNREVRDRALASGVDVSALGTGTAQEKWQRLQSALAEQARAAERLDTLQAESLAKCTPVFGEDCPDIMGAWLCLSHGRCDAGALEALEEQALRNWHLGDTLTKYCEDTVDVEYVCGGSEPDPGDAVTDY